MILPEKIFTLPAAGSGPLSPPSLSLATRQTRAKSPKVTPREGIGVPSELGQERVEHFGHLRQIEGQFAEAVRTGSGLFGTYGVGRLQDFLDRLFLPLARTGRSEEALARGYLVVFHVDPDLVDFSRSSQIQERVEDPANYTFWKAAKCLALGQG